MPHTFQSGDGVHLQGVKSGNIGYQALVDQLFDQLVAQSLDIHGPARGEMLDGLLALRFAIQAAGATGGMVDIGGNIRCFGVLPEYPRGWIIGLQAPRDEDDLIARLVLRDLAVATSGDYRRYAEAGGERQSHILDPQSGQSARELISVSIIAPTAMEADALSTAFYVMGPQASLDYCRSRQEIAAVLLCPIRHRDGIEIRTAGLDEDELTLLQRPTGDRRSADTSCP